MHMHKRVPEYVVPNDPHHRVDARHQGCSFDVQQQRVGDAERAQAHIRCAAEGAGGGPVHGYHVHAAKGGEGETVGDVGFNGEAGSTCVENEIAERGIGGRGRKGGLWRVMGGMEKN